MAKSARAIASLIGYVFLAFTVVTSIQFLAYWGVAHFIADPPTRGQFGDTFGITNSLFSGLAFLALIYTIRLQQTQLETQNDSLHHAKIDSEAVRKNQEFSTSIAALMNLIQQYDASLARSNHISVGGAEGAVLAKARNDVIKRRSELVSLLDDIHNEVVGNLRNR